MLTGSRMAPSGQRGPESDKQPPRSGLLEQCFLERDHGDKMPNRAI